MDGEALYRVNVYYMYVESVGSDARSFSMDVITSLPVISEDGAMAAKLSWVSL